MRLPALLVAASLATPAVASEPWVLDKGHAQVTFEASYLDFSIVHGAFRAFDADISFDPDDIEATALTVTIDAASVDTLWAARDEHLRGPEFLDVANHPEIVFTSRAVRRTGENTAEILGDLTMIGETHPVVFAVVLNNLGQNPFTEAPMAGFRVVGEIVRAEWGMTFGGNAFAAVVPIVADIVITQQ